MGDVFRRTAYNRNKLSSLAIDFKANTDNSAAMVTIPAKGVATIVSPLRIFASSTFSPDRGGLGGILNDIREECDVKDVIISRYSADGQNELSRVVTPMIRSGDFQTFIDLEVEVNSIRGVSSLENTELRVWFDGKASNERQYVLINYKIIAPQKELVL